MARAFDITPTSTNALMYIRSIFLTTDGSNASPTRITLDGLGGNGTFAGDILVGGNGSFGWTVTGSTLCLTNDSCITQRPVGGGWSSIRSTWVGWIGYYNWWNIGIWTSSPSQKLEVNGTGKFLGLCLGSDCRSAWPVAWWSSLWSTWAGWMIYYNWWNVGIWVSSPNDKLAVDGTSRFSIPEDNSAFVVEDLANGTNAIEIDNDTQNAILLDSANAWYKVGIGLTGPLYRLDVNWMANIRGSIKIAATNSGCSSSNQWEIKYAWGCFQWCNWSLRVDLNQCTAWSCWSYNNTNRYSLVGGTLCWSWTIINLITGNTVNGLNNRTRYCVGSSLQVSCSANKKIDWQCDGNNWCLYWDQQILTSDPNGCGPYTYQCNWLNGWTTDVWWSTCHWTDESWC